MENMAGKISGMIPNTINILRDNLHDRYDSGFPVLKELIQNDLNVNSLEIELANILKTQNRKIMLERYDQLIDQLGKNGASELTANLIIEDIKKN